MAIILQFPAKPRSEWKDWLDVLLERGAISSEQNWCGKHLRWLYQIQLDNQAPGSAWRHGRDCDYHAAIRALTNIGVLTRIKDVCTRNYFAEDYLLEVRQGLDMLNLLWSKRAS